MGRVLVGLVVLALAIGVAGRLFFWDDSPSVPEPTVVARVDGGATRSPAPTEAAATDTPEPTRTVQPTPERTITPIPTEPAVATRTSEPEPAEGGDWGAGARTPPGQTAMLPATRTPMPRATAIPSRTPAPPTATMLILPSRTPSAAPTTPGLALAANDCRGYDAWEWAQSVFESDRTAYAGLDPDGDGIACNGLGHGFAPAFWTDALPVGAVPGTIARIVDGDTYDIIVDGVSSRYRLYRADTPEVGNRSQCGGVSATEFAQYALSFADEPNRVWIDGVDQRDKYGRKLAYIWFTVAGEPYQLNHVLINNGWAEDIDYGDAFDPYDAQLRAAAAFARKHQLGVWTECGGFGVEAAQPTPVAASQQAPMGLAGNCNPNYSPCVPNVPYDLDCGDIGFTVQVIGYDHYRFDRDGDGWGCE